MLKYEYSEQRQEGREREFVQTHCRGQKKSESKRVVQLNRTVYNAYAQE